MLTRKNKCRKNSWLIWKSTWSIQKWDIWIFPPFLADISLTFHEEILICQEGNYQIAHWERSQYFFFFNALAKSLYFFPIFTSLRFLHWKCTSRQMEYQSLIPIEFRLRNGDCDGFKLFCYRLIQQCSKSPVLVQKQKIQKRFFWM